MCFRIGWLCLITVLSFCSSVFVQNCRADQSAIINYKNQVHSELGQSGMVVSQEAIASAIGRDILKSGGNAVDAAVAVGYALSVTLPRAGNIGGGGFMMVHLAEENQTIALDFREIAPKRAHENLFLNKQGHVDRQKALFSYQSAGVPGTVAGLNYALQQWGTLSLKQVIQPAIDLAEKGIIIKPYLASSMARREKRLKADPESKKHFFHKNGDLYKMGQRWLRPDLAWTLKQIKQNGTDAFYKGAIAQKIVAAMQQGNGLITAEDLANYQVRVRQPVTGTFNGYTVASMPPPSSGGVHLIQMLNVLKQKNIEKYKPHSANYIHLLAETAKYAYADRSQYLGDPDFYDVPVKQLISKQYATTIAKKIKPGQVTPSSQISAGNLPGYESPQTTHYSVMDKAGNAVSTTYTLNFSFGSGITVKGTGILLNNEMDDFSAKPGAPNAFGLIGGEANKIEPRKRPLSSMTPTIVLKDNKPYLVTGSPGGSTIITVVLQTVLNVIAHDMDIATATVTPRMHHQWLPDVLTIEPAMSEDTAQILSGLGYKLRRDRVLGSTQSIVWDGQFFYGFADLRRPGAGAKGY